MGDSRPAFTMRERVGSRRDRVRLNVLLNTSRWLLTSVLTAGMFGWFLVLGSVTPSATIW